LPRFLRRTGVSFRRGTGPPRSFRERYDESLIPPIHGGQKGVRGSD
jgi:hypothetical protein